MGRIRIVLFTFGIATATSFFVSLGEFVSADQADQLVGVTKATNLIGKQVTQFGGEKSRRD